jgi:hypothetical protein
MEDSSLKERIISLRKEGKSFNEIKKILNCSKGYISTVCSVEKLGNIGLNKSIKISDDIKDEIKEYYKTHTKEETSEKFSISTFSVLKYSERKRKKLDEEEKKKSNYNNVKYFRNKIKERAVEYKGGKCVVCGYNKCIRAFDFHHIDPKQKDFGISQNCNKAWVKVKIELDKCILVCSNCHREIHDGMVVVDNLF